MTPNILMLLLFGFSLLSSLTVTLTGVGIELKEVEQLQRQTSVPTGTVVITPKPATTAELQAQKLVNYQHRVQQMYGRAGLDLLTKRFILTL